MEEVTVCELCFIEIEHHGLCEECESHLIDNTEEITGDDCPINQETIDDSET